MILAFGKLAKILNNLEAKDDEKGREMAKKLQTT